MEQAEANLPEPVDSEDALAPGTRLLGGVYTIDRFLKSGGFGITYIAHNSLGRYVVIKECFPGAICARRDSSVVVRSRNSLGELAKVVNSFKLEVRALSRMSHKNIVKVHDVFDENDTAYMAMDLISGPDLLDLIDDDSDDLSPDRVVDMLTQLLGALSYVHGLGMLHRDISPDNILLNENGDPVLIDFGAAREESVRKSRALSGLQIVKDGYSPQELYIKGSTHGPTIDIYALGATFYHVITGEVPPDGNTRLLKIAEGQPDPYVSLVGRVRGYPEPFLRSIDKSLRVLPRDRFQSAEQWLAANEGKVHSAGAEEAVASLLTWLDTSADDIKIKTTPREKAENAAQPVARGPQVRTIEKESEEEDRTPSETLRMVEERVARKKNRVAMLPEIAPEVEEEPQQYPIRVPSSRRLNTESAAPPSGS